MGIAHREPKLILDNQIDSDSPGPEVGKCTPSYFASSSLEQVREPGTLDLTRYPESYIARYGESYSYDLFGIFQLSSGITTVPASLPGATACDSNRDIESLVTPPLPDPAPEMTYTKPGVSGSHPQAGSSPAWQTAKDLGASVLQIGANALNGLQDGLVGTLNLPIWVINKHNEQNPAVPDDARPLPYIPSPDWSRGRFMNESGEAGTWTDTHGWGKFGGGVVLGGGVSKAVSGLKNWWKGTPKPAPNTYRHGYTYSERVRIRAMEDPCSHNFPYSFDDHILSTKPIEKKNGYKIFQLEGEMNGKKGVFEIGLSQDGVIDHRFFRPQTIKTK